MRIKELEKLFKVLGNKRRLQIVRLLLKKDELTVSDIASDIRLSFKATSKHLLQLFQVDILEKEQRSKNIYYKIADSLNQVIKNVISHIYHSSE